MQRALTLWSGIIWATGGALVPEKTFWYMIDFSWQDGAWEYTPQEDLVATLEMMAPLGRIHEVERLDPDEARRTLGVQQGQ